MKKRSCKSLAGLALALVTGLACADTVTFDDLPRHHAGTNLGDVVDDGGFAFLSTSDLFAPGRRDRADPHGQTLASVLADQQLVVFRNDTGAFTLVSIDLGSLPTPGAGHDGDGHGHHGHHDGSDGGGYTGSSGDIELIYFVGTDPAFLSTILHLDERPGLQTFELGLQGVTMFGLYGVPFQLDNVVTEREDEPPAVPEPGSFATILAGLVLLVGLARRRRV